ncbi:hypothetical protein AGRO_1254 [Agrobacterium sp. ATCC 31749]|nr:hypothetical protein AGRO_1254 [Agrobacterium sp. ATCC 31749]
MFHQLDLPLLSTACGASVVWCGEGCKCCHQDKNHNYRKIILYSVTVVW